MIRTVSSIDEVLDRIDRAEGEGLPGTLAAITRETGGNLALAEFVLERWVSSRDQVPTDERSEGFRLIALHRQGAKGDPSFNACRETVREIVYQHNVASAAEELKIAASALRMQRHVLRHLALFVSGKLDVAGLGEFCCAAKPVRAVEAAASVNTSDP